MSKENFTSYFNGISDVFNPRLTYEGNYAFLSLALVEASKKENGHNLVADYLDRKFYRPIGELFQKLKVFQNFQLFLESDVNKDYGRYLKFSLILFVTEFCINLTGAAPDFEGDTAEVKQQVIDYIRNFKKSINAIMNGQSSPELDKVNERLIKMYKGNEKLRKQFYGINYIPLPYNKFLQVMKDYATSFNFGFKAAIPLFEQSINLDELEECLDLDKFYLTMAKQLIEISKLSVGNDQKLHNSFAYVSLYVYNVCEFRKNQPYDLCINTYTIDGTKIKYSVDDVVKEYNELRMQHPEYQTYHFVPDGKDYRNLASANEMQAYIEDLIASRELEASWNFIRNGERKISNEDVLKSQERLGNSKKNNRVLSRDEQIQEVADRVDFLDNTKFVYKVKGKNNFEGYMGYIYANGIVIFEKFYKKTDSYEPSLSNATYIMTFNNFIEMSKKTKMEIMEYIKIGASNLKRIYHTSTWCFRVSQLINSQSYDKEAMERVERLINDGDLAKKKIF